jgi:hypothetical protein
MNSETKTCTKCGEVKPLDAFGKNKSRQDGLQFYCRPCMQVFRKQYKQSEKGKESERAWRRKYRSTDRGKILHREDTKRYSNSQKGREAIRKNIKRMSQKYHDDPEHRLSVLYRSKKYKKTEKGKKTTSKYERLSTEKLADIYVKKLLTKGTPIKFADIQQSLIDLKRVQVQITRKLKEFKKCK